MFKWPQTRKDFWRKKFSTNVERDSIVLSRLKDQGWRVLTIWECALRGPARECLDYVLRRCESFVLDDNIKLEEIGGELCRELSPPDEPDNG